MVNRVASFYPVGVNQYVPAMAYAANLIENGPTPFSLGTPAAMDDDLIDPTLDADAVAGVITTYTYTADSPYGRTLTMKMSSDPGAALGVYDVYGTDYLGQPMIERFTHINGSTAYIYGLKAFYKVTKIVVITAATNAVTVKVGTGYRLGLPYKCDVLWAMENGAFVALTKRNVQIGFDISDADQTSGGSVLRRAEFPGYVKTLYGLPGGAGSTTNAAATVELETVAVTGLTVSADQDTQTIISDTPTTAGYNANNRFKVGDRIEIVIAATTAAGPTSYQIELVPTQYTPADITDPGTRTTGDPRGTYESITTMDDVLEIVVGIIPDNYVNSSSNGGLHGIRHYFP